MDLRFWVIERCYSLQGRLPRINGYTSWVRVDDEAVINIRLFFTQCECSVGLNAGVLLDWAGRNTTVVDDLVFVCDQSDLGAGDGRSIRDVEVTRNSVRRFSDST